MLKYTKAVYVIVAAITMSAMPVAAQDIVVTAHPTFRDLEYNFSGQDRIDMAQASFQARIPAGTPTNVARATMRSVGAHCKDAAENGLTKCTFSSFESIEDHLHDVVWTIGLDSQNGQIAHIDIARDSIGS